MSLLVRQLEASLPAGLTVPTPLRLLYDWIETRGLFTDSGSVRTGHLYPPNRLEAESTDEVRPGGTLIRFTVDDPDFVADWLGDDDPTILERLAVFATTGWDGSRAALWLDDAGRQRIVHLGSGSGSSLVCVLADEAVDFLRLLAIGYDELCDDGVFDWPPNAGPWPADRVVLPNLEYRDWVVETFATSVPPTARAIVRHPASPGGDPSPDPFRAWLEEQTS